MLPMQILKLRTLNGNQVMQYFVVHQFNQTLALIKKYSSGADKLFVYTLKPNFINQISPLKLMNYESNVTEMA